MGFFNRKKASIAMPNRDELDETLYTVPGTNINISHAAANESTIIFGSPGSGKSSSIGKYIALAMLGKGYGICVLCYKPDERKNWEEYVKRAGRDNDLIIFDNQSAYGFNFLQYEMKRSGDGAGDPNNIANTLMKLNELAENFQAGGQGKDSDRFWPQTQKRLVIRIIMLIKLSGVELNIDNMRRIVADHFEERDLQHYKELQSTMRNKHIDPKERLKAVEQYRHFVQSNFMLAVFEKANLRTDMSDQELEEFSLVADYWLNTFPKLSEKTRSIVIEGFNSLIEPLLSGLLKDKFASQLSAELLPENIYKERKIILVDFPVKEYGLSGLYANSIVKLMFQGAMERRDIEKEKEPANVGLYIDEFHNFLLPDDSLFMATARSSRTACVFITQNIQNLYMVGNKNPEYFAKSLLANIGLKYFCSNADPETNQLAADMIGQHHIDLESTSVDANQKVSRSYSQQLHYQVPPQHFTTLRTGRHSNCYKVDCIVFKAGLTWGENGDNFAQVTFDQNF